MVSDSTGLGAQEPIEIATMLKVRLDHHHQATTTQGNTDVSSSDDDDDITEQLVERVLRAHEGALRRAKTHSKRTHKAVGMVLMELRAQGLPMLPPQHIASVVAALLPKVIPNDD